MRTVFLAFLYSLLMRNFLKIIVGVKFRNAEVLKDNQQFILVANHNSHLDTMALLSALPASKRKNTHPIAAGDYFGKSKMKAFVTCLFTNAILIPRSRPVDGNGPDPVQLMFDALDQGKSLILFPEGSRGEPEKMQKFKKGIAYLLEKYPHIPYIPVYMKGLGKSLPKGDGLLVPFNSQVIFGQAQYCKKGMSLEEIVAEVEKQVLALQTKSI
jgi:1-acyl-sn-glycerol-3-phosphate acyltransferase